MGKETFRPTSACPLISWLSIVTPNQRARKGAWFTVVTSMGAEQVERRRGWEGKWRRFSKVAFSYFPEQNSFLPH